MVVGRGLLGLVASACGGVDLRFRAELVEPAAARGWQLAILLIPTVASWFEEPKPYRMPPPMSPGPHY